MANRKGMAFPYKIVNGKTKVSEDIIGDDGKLIPNKTIDNISILNYTYKGELPVDLYVGSLMRELSQEIDLSDLFSLVFMLGESFSRYLPYVDILDITSNNETNRITMKFSVSSSTDEFNTEI